MPSLFPGLSAIPWLLSLAFLIGGAGGTLWYRGQYEACQASAADAILKQQQADAAESARILAQEQARTAALRKQTDAFLQQVKNEPTTSSCGPSVRDAERGLRAILDSGAAQP